MPMIKLQAPGSKSITNRVLLLAAIAQGKSILSCALQSDDTIAMQGALGLLGIRVKQIGSRITIQGGKLRATKQSIFCGNAGTAVRFLTALCAAQPFESVIDGDRRMRERPIQDLLDALMHLGALAYSVRKNGKPPVRVAGPMKGGVCTVKGNVSSQFLSGLLIAAPLAQKDVTIKIHGNLVSKPYVDMTIALMRRFGVPVQRYGYKTFSVCAGQRYKARQFAIEGDASSASYFWGISALTGEKIEITNVPKNSNQGDVKFLQILERHFDIAKRGNISAKRKAIRLNCQDFPDSAMTLAVLCSFIKGKSKLTGLANLRVKECDRLHALATELRKIGCRVKELADGLEITGNPEKLHGAKINAYNDHRMAMCFGMLSTVISGITVDNPSCVKKTYPDFWKDLEIVKKQLRGKNIILTGMRGSGKTELGKTLAARLKRRFIDTDRFIEQKAGKTITEIVKKYGWKHFRALEKSAIHELGKVKHAVIATGGGALMKKSNERALHQNGKIIFLDCAIPILRKRLLNKKDRPTLTHKKDFLSELETIYGKREKRYRDVSDAVVDASKNSSNRKKDLAEKTQKILKLIAAWGLAY